MEWYHKKNGPEKKPNPKVKLVKWPTSSSEDYSEEPAPSWFNDDPNHVTAGEVVIKDGYTGFYWKLYRFYLLCRKAIGKEKPIGEVSVIFKDDPNNVIYTVPTVCIKPYDE